MATRAVRYAKLHGVVNFAAEGNSNDDHDNPTIDKDSPNDVEGAAVERNVAGGIDVPAMLNDSVLSVSALKLPTGADPATAKLERAGFLQLRQELGRRGCPRPAHLVHDAHLGEGSAVRLPVGHVHGLPHAAGVAALVKEIHPDYTADEVIALVKKQAGYTYDRLAEPTDGKEYRGAGLVNALDAVLKDQPKPVMGSVEYSYDGGTDWRPLADATSQA